jgi:Na+/H+-dicarboxylate symporter
MSKLPAILASLKAILIAASVAFARGDMLPVILISILLNLAELGAKPAGHAEARGTIVVPRSLDDRR